jgi:hypothetical protein
LTCFGNIPGGARQHNRLRMVAAVVGDRALQLREADPTAGSTEGSFSISWLAASGLFSTRSEKGRGLVLERQPEAPCALHDPPGQHSRTHRPRLDHDPRPVERPVPRRLSSLSVESGGGDQHDVSRGWALSGAMLAFEPWTPGPDSPSQSSMRRVGLNSEGLSRWWRSACQSKPAPSLLFLPVAASDWHRALVSRHGIGTPDLTLSPATPPQSAQSLLSDPARTRHSPAPNEKALRLRNRVECPIVRGFVRNVETSGENRHSGKRP